MVVRESIKPAKLEQVLIHVIVSPRLQVIITPRSTTNVI